MSWVYFLGIFFFVIRFCTCTCTFISSSHSSLFWSIGFRVVLSCLPPISLLVCLDFLIRSVGLTSLRRASTDFFFYPENMSCPFLFLCTACKIYLCSLPDVGIPLGDLEVLFSIYFQFSLCYFDFFWPRSPYKQWGNSSLNNTTVEPEIACGTHYILNNNILKLYSPLRALAHQSITDLIFTYPQM